MMSIKKAIELLLYGSCHLIYKLIANYHMLKLVSYLTVCVFTLHTVGRTRSPKFKISHYLRLIK